MTIAYFFRISKRINVINVEFKRNKYGKINVFFSMNFYKNSNYKQYLHPESDLREEELSNFLSR